MEFYKELSGLLLFVGLWVVAFQVLHAVYAQGEDPRTIFLGLANLLTWPFVIGAVLSPWLVNALAMVQVRK